jgi:hypothetical protein
MSLPSSTYDLSPKRIIGGAFKKLNFFDLPSYFCFPKKKRKEKKRENIEENEFWKITFFRIPLRKKLIPKKIQTFFIFLSLEVLFLYSKKSISLKISSFLSNNIICAEATKVGSTK